MRFTVDTGCFFKQTFSCIHSDDLRIQFKTQEKIVDLIFCFQMFVQMYFLASGEPIVKYLDICMRRFSLWLVLSVQPI